MPNKNSFGCNQQTPYLLGLVCTEIIHFIPIYRQKIAIHFEIHFSARKTGMARPSAEDVASFMAPIDSKDEVPYTPCRRKMATTLVTGASGHVGSNLVRSLIAQGRDVRVLVHQNNQALEGLKVERVRGDVCNADSMAQAFSGVDIVYHLAARVTIEMSGCPALRAVNIIGTRKIVAASLKHNVRRLVHFSSIDAMEQKPINVPVNESSPLAGGKQHPPYDRSKAAGEKEVRAGMEQGLDSVIVSPTAIIGPYDYQPSHQGQMLISMAQKRLPALVDGGFDWVDVRDVVYGAMQAEKLAPRGSKYILGGH